MVRNREKQRANRKKKKLEEEISTKNLYGFSDYTPYNAITGKDKQSKPSIIDPAQKVKGSFNG